MVAQSTCAAVYDRPTDLINLGTDSRFYRAYYVSLNYNLLVHKPFPQPCTGSLQARQCCGPLAINIVQEHESEYLVSFNTKSNQGLTRMMV